MGGPQLVSCAAVSDKEPLGDVLARVESRLREVAADAPAPVGEAAVHLVEAGGKRVRPQVLVLSSQVAGRSTGDVVDLAAAAELVHNASLLHDDVIDEAELRRGRPTSREVWGNAHSVLAGDHLMAAALELLEDSPVPGVLRTMLATMRRLVAGEVVQLAHRGKLLPDLDHYYQVVRGKTAALFSWCADAGARAGGADEAVCKALADYGEEVGVAFQLCDDLLDLSGSTEELGKSLLADLEQGVATLPVVLAAEKHPELGQALAAKLEDRKNGINALVPKVRQWVRETGADEKTHALAQSHIDRALEALTPLENEPMRATLDALAQGMINRRT